MNLIVCLFASLVLLTAPGDFAANRLFLLILLFTLVLLHHYMQGRTWYFRATEYGLIGSVFVVWTAGFFSPHYFLLQPIINGALTAHSISAVVYYWPTDAEARKHSMSLLYKAAPWFLVATLAQWKSADWLPQVKAKEKFLPPITVPDTARRVTPGDTTVRAINLFDSLSRLPR